MKPQASIVIVNWNTRDLVLQCLRSLRDSTVDLIPEIVVVDNGSTDGSADAIAFVHPEVVVVRSAENLGFARGNNLGFKYAHGDPVILLNSDTVVRPGAVQALIDELERHPEVGAVGGHQVNAEGCFAPSGYRFPTLWRDLAAATGLHRLGEWMIRERLPLARIWCAMETGDVDWVSGAFVAVRRRVWDEVGGLPEEFFVYGEDVEWHWRIRRAGWRVRYVHGPPIVHLEGRSATALYNAERAAHLLDGFYTFAWRHRNPVAWRIAWLALAAYWSVVTARWMVRARLTGNSDARDTARSLRSYVVRHLNHVLGRIPPLGR